MERENRETRRVAGARLTREKNERRERLWNRIAMMVVGTVMGVGVIGGTCPLMEWNAQPVNAAQQTDTSTDADADAGDDNCVDTAILFGGKKCDPGDGSSIMAILHLVVDILTMGIGILGAIGITVVGLQYLTAGGSEEKTRKAKTRMMQIVIGLITYAMIYALVKWLMPSVQ